MSQPPLSQQMQLLEQHVGTALFDRSTRRVALTLAGRALLDHARQLLHDAGEAGRIVRAIGRGEAGRLRIGLTDELIGSPAFACLVQQMRDHPDIAIETRVAYTVDLVRELAMESLDLVLCNEPADIDMQAMVRKPLPASAIFAISGPDMPVPSGPVRIEQLLTFPIILDAPQSDAPFSIQCRKLVASAEVAPTRLIHTGSMAAAIHLAAANLGICFVSEHNIAALSGACQVHRIDNVQARIGHALITQKSRLSPLLDNLVSALLGE